MKLYAILTMVNLLGSSTAIVCLLRVYLKYEMGPRLRLYIFISMVAMLLIIWGQVYSFMTFTVRWEYKLPTAWFWFSKMYFSWSIRFNLIKKN